jgi:hypothetical protein
VSIEIDIDTSAWDPDSLPPQGDKDDLVLLANESMRARRRPLAVAALWAWQTALAFLVAWPLSAAVGAFYGRHPQGDAPLWQPGALPLLDLAMEGRASIAETVTLLGLALLLAALTDLLPIGALLASIGFVTRGRRAPPLRAAMARGAAAFGALVSLFAMASIAQGVLVGLALGVGWMITQGSESKLGEARAEQLAWLVGLLLLAVVGFVGVLHDLARAAAVRFRVRMLRSWRCAWSALLRGPASVLWSWAWRGLAAWAPVAVGALVAARVGGRGGTALVALLIVHQLALFARVALRASWLAAAMRAVDHAHRVIRSPKG